MLISARIARGDWPHQGPLHHSSKCFASEKSQVSVFAPPDDVTLLGIDGLACYGDDLIAVQNGVRPHRVVRFVVNAAADGVERAEVLEANHPRFEEPTLGTVVGDTYFYVANSPWNRFDRDGNLPEAATLKAPVILKIELARDAR